MTEGEKLKKRFFVAKLLRITEGEELKKRFFADAQNDRGREIEEKILC